MEYFIYVSNHISFITTGFWCCNSKKDLLDSIRIKTYSNLLLKTYRYGFVHIGRVGSVFLTLSVTVERFFAIVYPLKRIRRTRFLIYSSVIGAIAYNIPRFLEFKTNYIKIDEGNETFEVRWHYPSIFICFLFPEKNIRKPWHK